MASERTTHRLHLHIVFVREHGGWVAQALQHDFAGQGDTPDEALRALAHTIGSHFFVAERRGIADPLAHVPEAPDTYWALFERAAKRAMKAGEIQAPGLPQAFVIQAIADQELVAH
jgi:hypothetical protein